MKFVGTYSFTHTHTRNKVLLQLTAMVDPYDNDWSYTHSQHITPPSASYD